MRLALVGLVAACGASTPAQRPFVPRDAPPGTRWITPALPWHLADGSGAVVVDGNLAFVAGVSRGEIEEIDLTTGARGRVHSLGKRLVVQSFERMSDGRYLLAGTEGDSAHVAFIDPTTFAPTWFTLERLPPAEDAYAPARALELAGHGIVITGSDLPLAIYDPTTMARTRVLKQEATWTALAVTRSAVFARRGALELARIDLATGATTTASSSILDAAGDTVVERTYEKGNVKFRASTPSGTIDLPATLGFAVTVDERGERIASLRSGVVTVYSTKDGTVIGRFDLAPQSYFSADLVFAGQRVIIAYANTIRVADLETGSLTSVPEPYGLYQQLSVDNAGVVTAIGAEVWRYRDGVLASTASLGKQTALVNGHPLTRFATRTSRPLEPGFSRAKFPSLIVVKTLEGRAIREVPLPRETDAAWIGDEGKLIASYKWEVDAPQKLVRAQGSKLFDIVAYNTDASIDDVDVDGSVAAFSLGGTATLLDLTTGEKMRTVYNPDCAEYGVVELERHGDRVVATHEQDAIVYDRATGRARGSARFAGTISNTTFLPGDGSILVRTEDHLFLWDPATNQTKELRYGDAFHIAISPDLRHAAFATRDGRLALIDFAALRAAMKPGPTLPKIAVPASCSTRDPFDLRDVPEDTGDSDGEGEDAGDDEDGDTGEDTDDDEDDTDD
ncbi:MAG: hypothetical protein ACKV2T_01325 [Kofleriaceae bacterium]